MKQLKKIFSIFALALLTLVHFSGISFLKASAAEVYRIEITDTYLEYAVVSELPVDLEGKIYNSRNNYVYEKSLVYTITAGAENAEIRDGNQLYINNAAAFTVRASLSDDASVYSEYTCNPVELKFSDVRIQSKIENITVYTQPIKLMGTVTVEGTDFPEMVHKEVRFEVVEGPAEIFVGDYLRFTGAGTVVLKAYSRYDAEAYVLKTITVTDPDAGKDVASDATFEQGELVPEDTGCGSVTSVGATLLALCGCVCFFIKRKRS